MKSTKTLMVIVMIIVTIATAFTYSKATENTDKPYIEVVKDMSKYDTEKIIQLKINLKNMKENISYFDAYIDYDMNVFEEVQAEDFSNELEEELNYFSYSAKALKIVAEFESDTKVEEFFTVTLKVKDGVTDIKDSHFKIEEASSYSYENDNTTKYENVETIFEQEKEEKPENKPSENPEETPTEGLYLSTEIYKIGNNDIKNYENGDNYISRVEKETTKEKFVSNLKTNGTIRILKHDGKELGENELVGTGMTLEVTKDKEKIELQIAVMGDLDGNGKVTATDLSTLNQTILKIVTLENEYKIAGDLDENEKISATDLSTLNKMILGIL